ncbi:C6 finger domain-containing protein [Pleurostoma richardsiae]|uniref:C6 finger domain-containing protein n=1 Tax=Pleurostoma richardsiae TaxID=41990 RepID=A0AA38RHZ6_9PEZI|nr:C6 finger domain-containing protein [Pleurostoma richardsiae]
MTEEQAKPPKSRRTHRKSRKGCSICKQRRIKCDETHPQCGNCVIGERLCSYLELTPSQGVVTRGRYAFGVADDAASKQTGGRGSGSVQHGGGTADGHAVGSGTTYAALHMVLLHHAECKMAEYMALEGGITPIIDAAVDNALAAPYLLDQVLALSALHLSTQDPATASLYHRHATELQTRALGLFNQIRGEICDSNYLPTFLFATLLGIHVLRDTLANHHHTISEFVGAFVDYVRLHRGVRAVTSMYWKLILQSELRPLLYITDYTAGVDKQTPGTETEKVCRFMDTSDVVSSSKAACLEALKWIQWVLDTAAIEPSRIDLGVHATMAWPLVIPDEFVEALYQHRPEALVVLAHYAAIMHHYRRYWVFGSAGSTIIQSITLHVGPFWADALTWPQGVLSVD